jgi:hypothetical protein
MWGLCFGVAAPNSRKALWNTCAANMGLQSHTAHCVQCLPIRHVHSAVFAASHEVSKHHSVLHARQWVECGRHKLPPTDLLQPRRHNFSTIGGIPAAGTTCSSVLLAVPMQDSREAWHAQLAAQLIKTCRLDKLVLNEYIRCSTYMFVWIVCWTPPASDRGCNPAVNLYLQAAGQHKQGKGSMLQPAQIRGVPAHLYLTVRLHARSR